MDNSRLKQISERAALNASTALSKVVGRMVVVKLSQGEVTEIADVVARIDVQENGVGVWLPVKGAVTGAALFFLPMADAIGLANCVLKRESEASEELGELELSALKEVGNIVTGAYMTVLSNVSRVFMVEQSPSIETGVFSDVFSNVLTQLGKHVEWAMVMSIDFLFTQPALKGYAVLLLSVADLESLFEEVECK